MLSSEQPWRHERGHVPTSVDWETGIKRGSDWLKPDSISDKKTLFLALVSRVPPKGYDLGTTLKSTNLNLFYKPCVLNIIACIVKYMTFYNFWDGKKMAQVSHNHLCGVLEIHTWTIFKRGFVVRCLTSSTIKFAFSIYLTYGS